MRVRRKPLSTHNPTDVPRRVEFQLHFTLSLPFRLRLRDGEYRARVNERTGYAIKVEAAASEIAPEAFLGETRGGVIFDHRTGRVVAAKGVDLPGSGLQYTKAEVVLHVRGPRAEATVQSDAGMKRLRSLAHACMNHFIDVYRFAFQDAQVWALPKHEFYGVRHAQPLTVESFRIEQGVAVKKTLGVLIDEGAPIRVGERKAVSDEEEQEFRTLLMAGVQPELVLRLLLDAEMNLQRGDTRLAVLDAAMAFDIAIEKLAVELWISHGIDHDQARARAARTNTGALIEFIEPRLRLRCSAIPPWADWMGEPRELRNRLVHDGAICTEDEALAALAAARKAVLFAHNLGFYANPEAYGRDGP
jgi:hypothetical protein